MRIASWMTNATDTHSEYVMLNSFSTETMVRRTRLNVITYVQCLSRFFKKNCVGLRNIWKNWCFKDLSLMRFHFDHVFLFYIYSYWPCGHLSIIQRYIFTWSPCCFSSVRHQVILTLVAGRIFQASFVTPGGLLAIKREPQHRTDIRLANPPAKPFQAQTLRGMPILGRHRISEQSYSWAVNPK